MDMGSSPQPAASVMGQQWADQLPKILFYLQQLGLQVSLHAPQPPPLLPSPLPSHMYISPGKEPRELLFGHG